MNLDEIMLLQREMTVISRLIIDLKLEEYLQQANMGQTLGPLLDPTLFIKSSKSLDRWIAMAKALRKAKVDLLKLRRELLCNDVK